MQQPNERQLLELKLRAVEIRSTPDFMEELWKAMHDAVYMTGEAIFVCHIRHYAKLSIDSRRASTLLDSFSNECMFGYPVKFTKEGQSLFYLIKQSGIDLNEPVIVTGDITSRLVESCERHPKARTFYVQSGLTLIPGSRVLADNAPTDARR